MVCKKCSTNLICRLKEYGGNFGPSLQWQNYDGSAHYKTSDGKFFDCNIPDVNEIAQTRIPTTPGDSPPVLNQQYIKLIENLTAKIDDVNFMVQRIAEMIEPIFQYTVNEQLRKK